MRPGTGTATVAAGDTLGFIAAAEISHFGPVQFYMAKVPDNADINTWEPAGNVWFKAAKIDAVKPNGGAYTSGPDTWPAYSTSTLPYIPDFFSFFLLLSQHALTPPLLTRKQRKPKLTSRSRRTCLRASISSASRALPSTRRRIQAVPRSICRVLRSMLRAVGMGLRDRWWRSPVRIARMIQGSFGAIIRLRRVILLLDLRSGRGRWGLG
jgi:hypothetical protein